MAKPPRSIETLVQFIRDSLAEMGEDGNPLALAHWSEADADAGYLLHTDGRMVGIGEYQYGFSHIDELLSPDLTDEVKKDARREAGSIAGGIEAIDLNDSSDPFDLRERLPYVFQTDADSVEKAVKAGKITILEMFDLLSTQEGKTVLQGHAGDTNFQVTKDILVSRVKQNGDGTLSVETKVEISAGENVKGFAGRGGEYASANVNGGHVQLTADEFVAPTPQPRKTHP